MSIEITNLTHHFGADPVLRDISLSVADGEIVALLGPSGSGKTTLLRIIAGLTSHTRGQLYIGGEEVSHLPAGERRAGFVFQHYALFRHMTVFDNIAFGLTVLPRKNRPSKKVIHEKVTALLEKIQLPHLAQRYPAQLSGGQQQRVALARALAAEPRILLLDEPFGALDTQVRIELRRWLRQLHQSLHFTAVFVTHDQDEALEVADRVVVMHNGQIEQIAAPDTLQENTENRFVTEFLGQVNTLNGVITDSGILQIGGVNQPVSLMAEPGLVSVFVRPWALTLSAVFSPGSFVAQVCSVRSYGHYRKAMVTTAAAGHEITVILPQDAPEVISGESVWLTAQSVRVFRGEDELMWQTQSQSVAENADCFPRMTINPVT
ncbi:sulfate ABC transporter ATP-binding protein [Morganella psychrotolerans]|uniref:Sulfate ABC transporter ATP-binding protein n=1 Tax=Morganella psychrotolerans TaxID=368603 RepID=A0A5M9RAL4_9GAMM|nr:sulfate ABC transporter ATP-binding protein [Morganella psychrotolerans]KAA8717593.1 sulfate ABC transporter ATP-binding protein [Morganella psychrotolerans]